MQTELYIAAGLAIAIGLTHSFLGERFILVPLFRRDNLPEVLGSRDFTVRTLRFAWHVTTIAWWGFAAILIVMAARTPTPRDLGIIIGTTFLVHFAIALIGSRGRHYSWIVFLAIGSLAIYATAP